MHIDFGCQNTEIVLNLPVMGGDKDLFVLSSSFPSIINTNLMGSNDDGFNQLCILRY